jgi:hypothetical protein
MQEVYLGCPWDQWESRKRPLGSPKQPGAGMTLWSYSELEWGDWAFANPIKQPLGLCYSW